MENTIPPFAQKKEINKIKLESLTGSSYCLYSVIENQLAVLYRNQEKLLKAIKLINEE